MHSIQHPSQPTSKYGTQFFLLLALLPIAAGPNARNARNARNRTNVAS